MDFRIGYRRPLRTATLLRKKRQRTHAMLAVLAAVGAVAMAANWQAAPTAKVATGAAAPIVPIALNSPTSREAVAARRIYPYSIVPGGVATRADLERRVATDQVVARHYASFDIKKAHAVTVATPRAVHVSYRKGDKVYWTKNKIMLAQGETLLSDGTSEMRGRCGNRISDTAMLPVAMGEPTAAELDESMNVAPDPLADGGLQNASFVFGDELPPGNPTQSRNFPGIAPSNPAPAEPVTRGGMPSVPAGTPNGMGLLPSRYLTVNEAPPGADTPATPVTPPVVSDPPVITLPPVSSEPLPVVVPPVVEQPPVVTAPPKTPVPPVPPETVIPPTEIPEPGTLPLVGVAFALLLAVTRKRGSQASR
jgi:hypothetical protein